MLPFEVVFHILILFSKNLKLLFFNFPSIVFFKYTFFQISLVCSLIRNLVLRKNPCQIRKNLKFKAKDWSFGYYVNVYFPVLDISDIVIIHGPLLVSSLSQSLTFTFDWHQFRRVWRDHLPADRWYFCWLQLQPNSYRYFEYLYQAEFIQTFLVTGRRKIAPLTLVKVYS